MWGSARILRKVLNTEWSLTWKRKCCKSSVLTPVIDHAKWPDVYVYIDQTSGFSSELSYCLDKKFCITLVARKSRSHRSLNCKQQLHIRRAFYQNSEPLENVLDFVLQKSNSLPHFCYTCRESKTAMSN